MLLLQVQGDKCSLADAVDIWVHMYSELPEQHKNNQRLNDKANMILTGVAVAAHMLHPIYRGEMSNFFN